MKQVSPLHRRGPSRSLHRHSFALKPEGDEEEGRGRPITNGTTHGTNLSAAA